VLCGNYAVNETGAVRRTKPGGGARVGRIRKARMRSGYLALDLWKDGKQYTKYVHDLVCTAFHGDKPPGPTKFEVRHLDGNRLNNCHTNLCWGTRSENIQDN
jgi:hypothetical protein